MSDIYQSFFIKVEVAQGQYAYLFVTIEEEDVRFMESASAPYEKCVRLEDLSKVQPADVVENEIIDKIFAKVDEMKKRAEKKDETQKQTFIKPEMKKENFFQRLAKAFKRNKS